MSHTCPQTGTFWGSRGLVNSLEQLSGRGWRVGLGPANLEQLPRPREDLDSQEPLPRSPRHHSLRQGSHIISIQYTKGKSQQLLLMHAVLVPLLMGLPVHRAQPFPIWRRPS